jgi:hypothetical protein
MNSDWILVLRLALLLSSEGTADARRSALQPNQQDSGLLNSTLAFRPHLKGETSSPDPFDLLFNKCRKREHPRTLNSQAQTQQPRHTNNTNDCSKASRRHGARIENYIFDVSSKLVLHSFERQHGASSLLRFPQCAVETVGAGWLTRK